MRLPGWMAMMVIGSLVAGCTSQDVPPMAPPAAPPPSATAAPAAPTSPMALQAIPELPGQPGPLTTRMRQSWPGDGLAWQSAALLLLTDPQNPMNLDDDERTRLGVALTSQVHLSDRILYRVSVLAALVGAEPSEKASAASAAAEREIPVEALDRASREALARLVEAAGSEEADAKPLPRLLSAPDPSDFLPEGEPTLGDEDPGGDAELSGLQDAIPVLGRASETLKGKDAARAAAEVRQILADLGTLQVLMREVIEVATAGDRAEQVSARALGSDAQGPATADAAGASISRWLAAWSQEHPERFSDAVIRLRAGS